MNFFLDKKEARHQSQYHSQAGKDSLLALSIFSSQNVSSEPSKPLVTSQYVSDLLGIESDIRNEGFFINSLNDNEDKIVRLCLHGSGVEPRLGLQPSSFEFEPLYIGQTGNRVLKITNENILPIKFKIHKVMNVTFSPIEEGWLKPEQSHEFLISVTPTCAGTCVCASVRLSSSPPPIT